MARSAGRVASNHALRANNWATPYAFIGPVMILVTVGLAFPAVFGAWSSFFSDQVGSTPSEFIGLANYRGIFDNPAFLNALLRSGIFVFGTIIVSQILAVVFAVTLQRLTGRGRFLRGVVLLPYLISGVAAAEFWRVTFHSSLGVPNLLLQTLGMPTMQWLGSTTNAMLVVVLAMAWLIAPLAMLIIFAGLQSIDPTYLEAARVDGATSWQTFRHVTFFLISRQFTLSLLWISFNAFNAFGLILGLTGGGPSRTTETLSVFMYFTAFQRLRIAEGLAIMMILLAINLTLSVVYLRIMNVTNDDSS